jgi:predicted anti-sigma-YlaC factor YlaD
MAGYWRSLEKHKTLIEKMERERTKLMKAHSTELAKVEGELDQETRNYTNYHLIMCRHLRHLHETVASIFYEVTVRCLTFPTKSAKVEEFID